MEHSVTTGVKKNALRDALQKFGLPRLIIAGFLLLLFVMAPFVGVNLGRQVINIINRFSWNAGLVLSLRGAQGGYLLARPPQEISVGEILRALEGPLAATDCVLSECEKAEGCVMHALWLRVHRGVNAVMDSITLQDMLSDAAPRQAQTKEQEE